MAELDSGLMQVPTMIFFPRSYGFVELVMLWDRLKTIPSEKSFEFLMKRETCERA